ncbi:guanylate-binding protein 6-like [Hyperolius riggenbachi]|uniref:guanylate-binding protein 6-like n=1 Tax=Hyperolius riggenbachi TaxID=752182 RepID=UPI0035A33D2E
MSQGTKTEFPVYLLENKVEGGKCTFMVNPNAKKLLTEINQPVVVVAFAGSYQNSAEASQTVDNREKKQKKLYIMKKLIRGANEASALKVEASIHTESKGIRMWCFPHPHKKHHTLVLLDTDPLEDVEKEDDKVNFGMFTLAVLLSSALVYDSDDTIDQKALEKLKFLKPLSKLISVKPQDKDDEKAKVFSHFPIFIWTVEKFDADKMLDKKLTSKDDYLKVAVQLKENKRNQSEETHGSISKELRTYFKQHESFVFDEPTTNKQLHQRLEELSDGDLNPRFVDKCQKLCDYIYHNAQEKKVHDGFTLTGQRLAELAENYIEALNSSNTIHIEKVVDSWFQRINIPVFEDAVNHYVSKMNRMNFLTQALKEFKKQSKECEEEAWERFLNKSVTVKDQECLTFARESEKEEKQLIDMGSLS